MSDGGYVTLGRMVDQANSLKADGYSNSEIAQRMGISENYVRNLIKKDPFSDHDDIAREIRVKERKSASGDRRWRATCPGDKDGFGATAEEALTDLIRINA